MINDFYWLIKFNKKFKNLFSYSIIYILFISSVILYILSLKGCFLSIESCLGYRQMKKYFMFGVFLIVSSILFGLLIVIQIIAKLRYFDFVIFSFIYLIIFFLSQGVDFSHHGTYNSIIFILLCPIFSSVFFIIYLILLFLFQYIFFYLRQNTICNNFYKGIGGIQLINDKKLNFCFIKKPRICGQDFLSGLFDVNIFRKKDCTGLKNKKKTFLKYLSKDLQIYNNFSYPRTEYWEPKLTYKNLAEKVENKIQSINNINSKNNEVFITFKGGKGKIKIQLKKNISLIKYKRRLAKKYPVKFKNIYMIYFDAISRNNFIRKLKKSSKLLESILYTNKRKLKEFKNYNAFQFFKYHNFQGVTQGNFFPIFYGNSRKSLTGISIIKFFNERGFITAAAHNSCNKEIFDWNINKTNIEFSHFDHENVAMFCDPNYEDKNHKWSIVSGKSSIFRRCFYGRDSFEYVFEYILQFLEIYRKERKFFRITFGDGHEGTNEVIKYIDNTFSLFLKKVLNNYYDNKSAIIIFSDHGPNIPGPYDILFYEEKMFEKHLGLLFIILPNRYNYYFLNILFNQQQFITAYDIYDTLLDMININKFELTKINLEKGQTLFSKINGKNRSCKKYEGEIYDCFCQDYE